MSDDDSFIEESHSTTAASDKETQLRKHVADRRYERRTVLIAAGLAALVALTVAGSSLRGLAWSVNDADQRDNRTFWRQQEAASVRTWLQAAGTLLRAEIAVTAPADSGTPVSGSASPGLDDMRTYLLKLGEETDALQLFVSPETYNAAGNVAKLQSDLQNFMNDVACSGETTDGKLPAGCSRPPTIDEIARAEQEVLRLAQADLNKRNGPK